MSAWSKDELRMIAEKDDLHISPFRDDGVTYGTPTWIWSVEVVLGQYAAISGGFYLYYPKRSQVLPKFRAFLDHLKNESGGG